LRLFIVSREVERVVLADLLIISKKDPVCSPTFFKLLCVCLSFIQDLLAPHYTRFLVRCDDLKEVKKDKIRLMLNVVNDENWAAILREFIVCSLFFKHWCSDVNFEINRTMRRMRTIRLWKKLLELLGVLQ